MSCEVLTSHPCVVLNGMRCGLWRNANYLLSAVKGFGLERMFIDVRRTKIETSFEISGVLYAMDIITSD